MEVFATIWIIVGCIVLVAALAMSLWRVRVLRRLGGGLLRVGKTWRLAVERYHLLRFLNTVFYLVGVTVTLAGLAYGLPSLFTRTPTLTQPILIPNTSLEDDTLEAEKILEFVNEVRAQQGKPTLSSDPVLTKTAEKRLLDMVENHYYAHESPEGYFYYDLLASEDYHTGYSCENLNVDFTVRERRYIESWITSTKGHKECLLDERVNRAGYAVGIFNEDTDSSTFNTYLVVGIHAAAPTEPETPVTPTSQQTD